MLEVPQKRRYTTVSLGARFSRQNKNIVASSWLSCDTPYCSATFSEVIPIGIKQSYKIYLDKDLTRLQFNFKHDQAQVVATKEDNASAIIQ